MLERQIGFLKAEMKAVQKKKKMTNNKQEWKPCMQDKLEANQEKMARLEDKMETHQARTEAKHEEVMAKFAHHERMKASVNAWQKGMMTYQEMTEAYLDSKEPNLEEMQSIGRSPRSMLQWNLLEHWKGGIGTGI